MTLNYFNFGKIVILGLAAIIPLILYRSLESRIQTLQRDAQLQSYFAQERDRLVRQVLERRLQSTDIDSYIVFKRALPLGPIQGLAPFPETAFAHRISLNVGAQEADTSAWIALLHDASSFPSGMPKRYAGFLELIRQDPLYLSDQDRDRLLEVAGQFWVGEALNNSLFTFLIRQKLPKTLRPLFSDHLLFLGVDRVPEDDQIWLGFERKDTMVLAALPSAKRSDMNRDLQALRLETALVPSKTWTDLGTLRVSLKSETLPLAQRLHKEWLAHGILLFILEGICLLIYLLFHKYQKVNRLQHQLLAATSHELRTPLAVIRQFAEMLLDRSQRFESKIQTYHQFIYRECLKLQFLVENLLSAAKFENLKSQTNPVAFDLKHWLEEEVASLKQVFSEHAMELQAESVEVYWDQSLVSQILTNLVDNARKHAQTPIHIEARTLGNRVVVGIRDFGETFQLDSLQKIRAFHPYDSQKAGLGLGLFLCKKMMAVHGGELRFEDANPGLRVVLDLPKRLKIS